MIEIALEKSIFLFKNLIPKDLRKRPIVYSELIKKYQTGENH